MSSIGEEQGEVQRHSTWIEVIDMLESSTSSLQNQVMLAWIHEDAHFIQVDWSIVPPGMFVTWTFGANDDFALSKSFSWHLNNLHKVFDIWIDMVDGVLDNLEQVSQYSLLCSGGSSWNLHLHVVKPQGAF